MAKVDQAICPQATIENVSANSVPAARGRWTFTKTAWAPNLLGKDCEAGARTG